MRPNDADGMANSAPGPVYTVCPDLSVRKLINIIVVSLFSLGNDYMKVSFKLLDPPLNRIIFPFPKIMYLEMTLYICVNC